MDTKAYQITSVSSVYSSVWAQIKENIKAPHNRPLWGESTGAGGFPSQRDRNAENISIRWCHHASGPSWFYVGPMLTTWTLLSGGQLCMDHPSIVNHTTIPTLIHGFVSEEYGTHAKSVATIPSSARPQLNGHDCQESSELASQIAPAEVDATFIQCAMTEPGTNLPLEITPDPVGPRWAPCWPHELCYQGPSNISQYACVEIFEYDKSMS